MTRLWSIPLELPPARVEALAALLDEAEGARAAAFHFPLHRRRFVVRRAALRLILQACTGISAADLRFETGSLGRPYLAPGQAAGLDFSTSHSDELALVAVAHAGRVAVDLERIKPQSDLASVAQRFFAPEEAAWVLATEGTERVERFYRCWVLKEAFVKALGQGLQMPLESFAFVAGAEPPRLSRAEAAEPADWHFRLVRPQDGWLAALASARDFAADPAPEVWSWDASQG
jgi:4'-phosphopantetheinyl transferase